MLDTPEALSEPSFVEWEAELIWVKEYRRLLSQDHVSPDDCEVLPRMRMAGALADHESKAQISRRHFEPIAPQLIQEKFQVAINHIVFKFCKPIETEFNGIVQRLEQQVPQQNDHELFTDELKEKYIRAAVIRHHAMHNSLYNNRFSRNFGRVKPEVLAGDNYEANKESFRKRYLNALTEEKRILQEKFTELCDEEKQLEEAFETNKQTIKELQSELQTLTNKLGQQIEQLTLASETLVHEPRPVQGPQEPPPPPPPPPAMIPMPASSTQGAASARPVTTNPFTMSPDVLTQVKLRAVVPRPRHADIPAPAASQMLSGLLMTSAPTRSLRAASKAQTSGDELDAIVLKIALSIHHKEQDIVTMQERNKKQKDMFVILTRQKNTLIDLKQQLQSREAQQKKLSQSLQVSEIPVALAAPPPPPPPKAPPLTITALPADLGNPIRRRDPKASRQAEVSASSVAIQSPDSRVPQEMVPLMQALAKRLAERRVGFKDEEDEEDEVDSIQANTDKSQLLKREADERMRQKQRRIETVNKYVHKVREKLDVVVSSPRVSLLRGQIRDLGAGFSRTSNTVSVVERLIQKFDALGDVRPLPSAAIALPALVLENESSAPISSVLLPPEEFAPQPRPVLPREEVAVLPEPVLDIEEIAEAPQALVLIDCIHRLLQDDADALAFYQQNATDERLSHALQALENPMDLTKPVVMDLLIICDYVTKKRAEIVTRNLSPNVAEIYNSSLDGFYEDALNIRLSNQAPTIQYRLLKEAANTHLKPRHREMRFFADAVIMISALCLAGLVIGGMVIGVGLLTSSFFSQKPSDRKRDFEKRLNNDEGEELLKGSLGPIQGG